MIRIFVVATLAALGGCTWQKVLWDDGYIPLPALGVVKVTSPDDSSPSKVKLTTKYVLVGTYREARAEDFKRGEIPWLWNDVPSLTETALPVELTGGAEKYEQKIGLKINVETLVRVVDVTADVGPSKTLTLSKFWRLVAPALSEANAHLVLAPMAGEIRRAQPDKTFFLLTNAVGGDISDESALTVKVTASVKDSPLKGGIEGGPSSTYTAQGVVLGVQGQILTRKLRSAYLAPVNDGGQVIAKGSRSYPLDRTGANQEDVLDIRRDDQNRLYFGWRNIPGTSVFAGKGSTLTLASDGVPADSTWVLVGFIRPEGWRLLSVQLRQTDDGSPAITAAGAYEFELRTLDATNLVSYFNREAPPAPPPSVKPVVSAAAWRAALGSDALLEQFVHAQEEVLALGAEADETQIARYDIAEIVAPVKGDPKKNDLVHVTRYDVRGQAGRKFKFEVYKPSNDHIVRQRIWAQKTDGTLHDLTPTGSSFKSSSAAITVPEDVDYLYMRAGTREDATELNMIGFHGGRHGPVRELTWDTAFVAPLGRQCRLVTGDQVPDAPKLASRARVLLPAWARQVIGLPAGALEEEVRGLQKLAAGPLDICHFSVSNLGTKVAWLLHAE